MEKSHFSTVWILNETRLMLSLMLCCFVVCLLLPPSCLGPSEDLIKELTYVSRAEVSIDAYVHIIVSDETIVDLIDILLWESISINGLNDIFPYLIV
jgi:hypothetical protein